MGKEATNTDILLFLKENEPEYRLIATKKNEKGRVCAFLKCPNINHKPYWVVWTQFKTVGERCRSCQNDKNRIWTEDFVTNYVCDYTDYKVLGYKLNSKGDKMVLVKCPVLEHEEYWIVVRDFINKGCRCKKCRNIEQSNKTIKWTDDKIKQWIYSNRPQFKLLSIERDNKSQIYITLSCIKENHETFRINFTDLRRTKRKCKFCKDEEMFNRIKNKIEKKGFLVVGNSFEDTEKLQLKVQCQNGHEYITHYKSIIYNDIGCAYCFGNAKKEHDEYLQELKELHNLYEPIENYINSTTPIAHKHNKCGYVWSVSPFSITKYYNDKNICPNCAPNSMGEEKIKKTLDMYHIKYQQQYKIEKCFNKRKLPFDFAIFDFDNSLKFLLEYQGEQHYRPVLIFGGEKQFIKQKQRDNIKKVYCHTNNITLIEIPYWESENIENIIGNLINKFNLKEVI